MADEDNVEMVKSLVDFWNEPDDDDNQANIRAIIKEDRDSNWGRYFLINNFLNCVSYGILLNSSWVFLMTNPVKDTDKASNLNAYFIAVVLFVIVGFIARQAS